MCACVGEGGERPTGAEKGMVVCARGRARARACVRARVRACVRAGVCACVRVCVLAFARVNESGGGDGG